MEIDKTAFPDMNRDAAPFAQLQTLHALEDAISFARTATQTQKPSLMSYLHIALCFNAAIDGIANCRS
jgi:hypothetical protein